MPITQSSVRPINPVATQFALGYSNDMYVSDKVFPVIQTGATGTYFTYPFRNKIAIPKTRRAGPGSGFPRGRFDIESSSFTTVEDAHELPIDRVMQKEALKPINLLKDGTEAVTDILMLRREKNFITEISDTTTNFATNTAALTGTDRWDDDNSDPVKQFDTRAETIRKGIGVSPNTVVMAQDVWIKLKEHPGIKARVKSTEDTVVMPSLVAKLFDIPANRLFIVRSLYESAEEGQTSTPADNFSGKVFIAYVNPQPSIFKPSVGYTLQSMPFTAQTYYEDSSDSDVVRVRVKEVHKIISQACGFVLTTVIS